MQVAAFLSYVFVTAYTPGPNNIMAMSNANRYGFKKSLKFNFGVGAGFVVIMLLCSYFNLFMYSFIPKIEFAMKIVGGLYMLYLCVKIIRSKPTGESTVDGKLNSFLTGMWLQFINPKVILYGITAFSTFVIPYYQSNTALILFSLLLAVIGCSGTICWAIFGAVFQRFLSKYRIQFNIAMGLLLLYSAVSIWA
ncbi:MAG: LysE family transporter [Tumebacillaceae bacterium]